MTLTVTPANSLSAEAPLAAQAAPSAVSPANQIFLLMFPPKVTDSLSIANLVFAVLRRSTHLFYPRASLN
jgi:hypothetical protein